MDSLKLEHSCGGSSFDTLKSTRAFVCNVKYILLVLNPLTYVHVLLCVEFTFASTAATVTNHKHTVDNLILVLNLMHTAVIVLPAALLYIVTVCIVVAIEACMNAFNYVEQIDLCKLSQTCKRNSQMLLSIHSSRRYFVTEYH